MPPDVLWTLYPHLLAKITGEQRVRYFIGVDVGGTTSTICIGNEQREVLYVSDQFTTAANEGPHVVIAAIVEQVILAIEKLGGTISDVEAAALATPGPATIDGLLLKTPNLNPELWDRFPIRGELEVALQKHHASIQVSYIGDGQAAALGEFSVRSGNVTWSQVAAADLAKEPISSLFMAIVGTGLGGGAAVDGKAVRGSEGRAGHLGHITLPPYAFRYEHDRQLQVGNALCTAESAVSLTGLSHQLEYRLSLEQWRDHPLNSLDTPIREKAKQLRSLAGDGDELAIELFDDQAHTLGIALLTVNYIGDFDLLVIGGGVCDLSPSLRESYRLRAEKSYRQYALDGFRNLARFEYSCCGDEAPVIGALVCALPEAK